jgi:glutamyl-tRNA reductase
MNLFCLGLTHDTADVARREILAFSPEQSAHALHHFSSAHPDHEWVLLSTCNRTEFYVAAPDDPVRTRRAILDYLREVRGVDAGIESLLHFHRDEACVKHLFEVASGLQSMVVGETEIFGQTKTAYERAVEARATGKYLNRLFQHSFAAAKHARSASGITRGTVSVASVAVELAGSIFGDFGETRVLVLGAGETSERVARVLAAKGVRSIFVANRTFERASQLAQELAGEAVRWEQWESWITHADIMISSTAAPHHLLDREKLLQWMPKRNYRPLFLIDLAVPRDFDPSVSSIDSVYLYDIDDLQGIAAQHLAARQQEIEKCRLLLHRHEEKFWHWFHQSVRKEADGEQAGSAGTGEVVS